MIIHGDSNALPLADCSVDAVVTDPPYGLAPVNPRTAGGGSGSGGFMGKAWDRAVPSVDIWREVLRVLKPGGFAAVMCTPRQDCQARMILNLEEAGFVTGFTSVLWTYATGFPKAANLSKLADKRAGAEREAVGPRQWTNAKMSAGMGISGLHQAGSIAGEYNGSRVSIPLTAPATPKAKALDGAYAGFQPKPAFEPVLVAMKPLSQPTYLDQALDNGGGCSWLDDGRIPTPDSINVTSRFPANVLCSDNVMDDGRVARSGGTVRDNKRPGVIYGGGRGLPPIYQEFETDSGSYSRYFDLDAWWAERVDALPEEVRKAFPWLIVPKPSKREKNAGLRRDPVTVGDGRQKSIDNPFQRGQTERVNSHVSVKPVKLMAYLIALFSRPGDVVLDPFAGSGSTAVAAQIMGRVCMGVELEPEYAEIAAARESYAAEHHRGTMAFELGTPPKAAPVDTRQAGLFDETPNEEPDPVDLALEEMGI